MKKKTRLIILNTGIKKKTIRSYKQFRKLYSKDKYVYDRTTKTYKFTDVQKIIRNSIVFNFDSEVKTKTGTTQLTPKGNRAEIRVIYYTMSRQTSDIKKQLYNTILNLTYCYCNAFLGAVGEKSKVGEKGLVGAGKSKFTTTGVDLHNGKLTIGEEIEKVISITEMKQLEDFNYCYKYVRIKLNKFERVLINEEIEHEVLTKYQHRYTLGKNGFVFRKMYETERVKHLNQQTYDRTTTKKTHTTYSNNDKLDYEIKHFIDIHELTPNQIESMMNEVPSIKRVKVKRAFDEVELDLLHIGNVQAKNSKYAKKW